MILSPDASAFIDSLIRTGNIVAAGLGGSRATGSASEHSDIDLYLLTNRPIDLAFRRRVIESLTDSQESIELGNPYWGDEDGFMLKGIWHDVVYFDAGWFFGEIDAVLNQHRPSEGYSTSFVYTLAHMIPLHDPDGHLSKWKAQTSIYPDALAESIITRNYPVACTIHASYRNQIARAVQLADPVAVNHRMAAFLACIFDITFAALRMWHPGEKRQLNAIRDRRSDLPVSFDEHIKTMLINASTDGFPQLLSAVDRVVDDVTWMIEHHH